MRRRENEYVYDCLAWLFNAIAFFLLLQYIRRIHRDKKSNHLPSCLRLSLSRDSIPENIAKDWVHRFSTSQIEFLVRVARIKHENIEALQAHLNDDSWRMEGIDFVDSILFWLLAIQAHPVLIVVEALVFVGGNQRFIPKKIVDFTVRQVFMDSSRQRTLMQQKSVQSDASIILGQLEELGLLYQVQNGKAYCLSMLIRDRPIRIIDWNKKFLIYLDRHYPDYSTHHLIRLMIRANSYEKAMEIMESEKFCRKRVKRLGHEAAVRRHVVDCTLLLKYSESSMLLPRPRINQACSCLANHIHDAASLLILGDFLQNEGLHGASNIFQLCLESTMQDIRTNFVPPLSRRFHNVATIYLCYGNEENYRKYKDIARDIRDCNQKIGVISLLELLKVPLEMEKNASIFEVSDGLRYHIKCIKCILDKLDAGPLSVLLSVSRSFGDVELSLKVMESRRLIRIYNKY